MTTEKLIEKAREYHAAAMAAITAAVNGTMDCGESRKRTITNFINAEFSFGKYHGIMEILEQQDMEKWLQLAEELQEDCHKFLEGMDALYYLN